MSEWVRGNLLELAAGVRGVSYAPDQLQRFMSPDTIILLRSNNIKGGQVNFDNIQLVPSRIVSKDQLARHGDIAVCMSNGSKALVGKSGRIEGNEAPCTVGAFCSIFRPHTHADEKFVSYIFQSSAYRSHLDIILAGSAINNLKNSDVETLSLEIPPRKEQRFIAHILDTLDTQIQKTEALIAKLEKVKEGLLHDLLTRGIDETGQLRPSPEQAPELYKESPLGLIPREWQYGQLQDFGQLVSGQHIPGELSNRDGRGVPYFTGPTDFYSGKTVTSNHTEFPQAMCSMGDLLITVKGSGCGKTAIASTDACISRQLMAFSFREAEKGFWRAFFSSNEKMINKIAEGGAIPGISRRQLLHISAACPKTEHEYIAISETIGEYEKRQFSEARQLKKLIKQKSGLMDDLLTGGVRVTPLLDTTQATTPA